MYYNPNHEAGNLVAAVRVGVGHGDTAPHGTKVIYDDDYQAIKARIDALGTLSGRIDQEKALSEVDGTSIFEDDNTSDDFAFIVETGMNILAEKSKDLRIACYVALGLYRTDGLGGLATGLDVLHALVDTYWENLYPAKHRMRARGAAVGFLMHRLSRAFEANPPSPSADDREALKHSLDRLDELQSFFMEEMGEHAPITSRLKRLVNEALRNAPEPEPTSSARDSDASAQAEDATEDTNSSRDSSGESRAPHTHSAPLEGPTENAKRTSSSGEGSRTQAPAATVASPATIANEEAVQDTDARSASVSTRIPDTASENEIVQGVVRAAGILRDTDQTDPRAYRLSRSMRWDPLYRSPPNDRGQTQIQPPNPHRRTNLRGLLDEDDTATLIQQAEDTFQEPAFHFWLDLQWLLVRAMDAEGPAYTAARKGITADVVHLIRRVPDLPTLSFIDGTPFANASTRAWITGEVEAATSDGDWPADTVAKLIHSARSTLRSDGLSAALDELAGASVGNGRRNAFRVRLAKGKFCLESDRSAIALPLLMALSDDLDVANTPDFDPRLAVDTWCALYRACRVRLTVLNQASASNRGASSRLGRTEDTLEPTTEVARVRRLAQNTYRRICAASPARAIHLDISGLADHHTDG